MKNKKTEHIREEDMSVRELSVLMLKSFDSAQQYVDKRFESITHEVRSGFKKVETQINTINRNNVNVVRQEDFNKLENRVTDIEEVLELKIKKN